MVNVLDKDKILWYVMRAYKNEKKYEREVYPMIGSDKKKLYPNENKKNCLLFK